MHDDVCCMAASLGALPSQLMPPLKLPCKRAQEMRSSKVRQQAVRQTHALAPPWRPQHPSTVQILKSVSWRLPPNYLPERPEKQRRRPTRAQTMDVEPIYCAEQARAHPW
jgi:hypothetical protein